jgi:hypothetical protein
MFRTKKKQLPDDFEALLQKGDLEELKRVFDKVDVNARGGIFKQTALAFRSCPDDLARWLAQRGADLGAPDKYGATPLHSRAGNGRGRIDVLLELGVDVNGAGADGRTPLHATADSCNAAAAALLLQHGARVDACDRAGMTPLARALQRCSNAQIDRTVALVEVLLAAGAQQTSDMRQAVARIGTNFEFYRSSFDPGSVDAVSAALDKLYGLFGVPAVPRRTLHAGSSPIVAQAARREDQFEELWDLLVPGSGSAATVQGEVVRIAGRICDELERNGGVNWDAAYGKMADAFATHVASGSPLAKPLLDESRELVKHLKRGDGDPRRLCELAVDWVAQNPAPLQLSLPGYER